MNRRFSRFLPAVALAILVLIAASSSACSEGDGESQAHVEDLRYRLLPGDARIITGTFVNDSDESIGAAQIEVSLFDEDNRRISTMQILVQDIAPGSSKEFREPVDSRLNVQGARVRRILVL